MKERLVRFFYWSQIGNGSFANGYADLTVRVKLTRKFVDGEVRDYLRKELGQSSLKIHSWSVFEEEEEVEDANREDGT